MDLSRFTQPAAPATNVVGVAPVELPVGKPTVPDISKVKGRVDFYKTTGDYYMKEAERAEAEKAKAESSTLAKLAKDSESRVTELPDPAKIREEARGLTGFDDQATKDYFAKSQADRVELATLTAEYDKLLADRDAAIEAERTRVGGTTAGANDAIAKVTRDFASRLNQQSAIIKTKSALMEASQGNFKEAQAFIQEAVQDATYDARFNLDVFSTFYGKYENQLEKLDSKYADAIKSSLNAAEEAYTTEYNEKSKVGELMINPDYKGAGITLNDSLETAFQKISSGLASGSIGDDVVADNPFLDTMQEAIDAGATPEEAAREAALKSELTGIPVSQETLSAWVKQARKLNKTPIVETPVDVVESKPGFFSRFFGGGRTAPSNTSGTYRPLTSLSNLRAPVLPETEGAFFSNLFSQ